MLTSRDGSFFMITQDELADLPLIVGRGSWSSLTDTLGSSPLRLAAFAESISSEGILAWMEVINLA